MLSSGMSKKQWVLLKGHKKLAEVGGDLLGISRKRCVLGVCATAEGKETSLRTLMNTCNFAPQLKMYQTNNFRCQPHSKKFRENFQMTTYGQKNFHDPHSESLNQ